ncbi:hypothetical protein [Metabacillus fastidiosus]|uniref:hypothetical protein n=1 Tax=Metabacillus fastidiosus TaxID=1458 RepID=UPI003D2B2C61
MIYLVEGSIKVEFSKELKGASVEDVKQKFLKIIDEIEFSFGITLDCLQEKTHSFNSSCVEVEDVSVNKLENEK